MSGFDKSYLELGVVTEEEYEASVRELVGDLEVGADGDFIASNVTTPQPEITEESIREAARKLREWWRPITVEIAPELTPEEFRKEFERKLAERCFEMLMPLPVTPEPEIALKAFGVTIPPSSFYSGPPIVASAWPYGSPAAPCTCGSSTCNKCRAQRGMGPAGKTPAVKGALKPGGPTVRPPQREKGYRVVSYDELIAAEVTAQPGDRFSTPDIAISTARRRAKAEKRAYMVVREGKDWQTIYGDGSSTTHEPTQA